MKRILVTGGSGFIGKNIREALSKEFQLTSPSSIELNLLDAESVEEYLMKQQFDIVIHAAVFHATRNSNKDPNLSYINNIKMYDNLAKCNSYFDRLIYFGSGAEFGKQSPIVSVKETEIGTVNPIDGYGRAKLYMQQSLEMYKNVYNLRLFGIFGKYEDWEIRFISNAICRAIFNMDIIIKQNVNFDYLYIDDFIKILRRVIILDKIPYKDINICTGKKIDLKAIAKIIKEVSNRDIKIKVLNEGYQNEYTGNNDRLLSTLRPVTFTPIRDAITQLYHWYDLHCNDIDPSKLSFDVK